MIYQTKDHIPQTKAGYSHKRPVVDIKIAWGKYKGEVSVDFEEAKIVTHINGIIIPVIYTEMWYKPVPTVEKYNGNWIFVIQNHVAGWNRYDLARYRRLTKEIQAYVRLHRAAFITKLEGDLCSDDQTESTSSSGPHQPTEQS